MSSLIASAVRSGIAQTLVSVAQARALSMQEVQAEADNLRNLCREAEEIGDGQMSEDLLTRLWIILAYVPSTSPQSSLAIGLRASLGQLIWG